MGENFALEWNGKIEQFKRIQTGYVSPDDYYNDEEEEEAADDYYGEPKQEQETQQSSSVNANNHAAYNDDDDGSDDVPLMNIVPFTQTSQSIVVNDEPQPGPSRLTHVAPFSQSPQSDLSQFAHVASPSFASVANDGNKLFQFDTPPRQTSLSFSSSSLKSYRTQSPIINDDNRIATAQSLSSQKLRHRRHRRSSTHSGSKIILSSDSRASDRQQQHLTPIIIVSSSQSGCHLRYYKPSQAISPSPLPPYQRRTPPPSPSPQQQQQLAGSQQSSDRSTRSLSLIPPYQIPRPTPEPQPTPQPSPDPNEANANVENAFYKQEELLNILRDTNSKHFKNYEFVIKSNNISLDNVTDINEYDKFKDLIHYEINKITTGNKANIFYDDYRVDELLTYDIKEKIYNNKRALERYHTMFSEEYQPMLKRSRFSVEKYNKVDNYREYLNMTVINNEHYIQKHFKYPENLYGSQDSDNSDSDEHYWI